MTTKEASQKWGIGVGMVKKYICQNRIPKAEKLGRDWFIPDHTEKPEPLRTKERKN